MAKRPKANAKLVREGEKRPRGRPRKDSSAAPKEPRKLTPDEASVVPVEMLAAARNGDKTAIEALDEILSAYNRLRLAMAQQAEITEACRQRTKSEWASLTGAIESPIKIDADVAQLRRKLEDVEVRWQEYNDAIQANKIETNDARKATRAAQKDLDEAVKGSTQLKLPFPKETGEVIAVKGDPCFPVEEEKYLGQTIECEDEVDQPEDESDEIEDESEEPDNDDTLDFD